MAGLAILLGAVLIGSGPAAMSPNVTNPWFPLRPGHRVGLRRQEGREADA